MLSASHQPSTCRSEKAPCTQTHIQWWVSAPHRLAKKSIRASLTKQTQRSQSAFVIRTGFQATNKNSRLIREWETFLSRLRVAKQLVACKLVHKGEEWQFSTTSFMSMIQFPLSLFGVWVWSSNFCPHHAVSCSKMRAQCLEFNFHPSWLDHQTTALDIETPSTSVHLSVREEHLPIGYKILSRLTCLGSRFVSRPSWLAIVMTVPSLGYSIFDAPHEMQDVASCFSYFGVHEGTGTLTQSQVDQALLSCLSHLGRYLGHHRVFPWLSVMSEETLKAKQNQALTVPLERPRQTGSSDMCIPCFTSAKRSVEWCEQWIWSHPPSDKLYFREAPCQAMMCLEKKMRAMNLGV